ncbi:MAG: hypothetical protein ACRDV4_05860, partial [Acidimicrobiales bacterium]
MATSSAPVGLREQRESESGAEPAEPLNKAWRWFVATTERLFPQAAPSEVSRGWIVRGYVLAFAALAVVPLLRQSGVP